MNVRFPLLALLGNRVVTTLLFFLDKALPPSGLALQVSLLLVTCDYFAIPLVMLSNAAPASSGSWHLLSRSVCPSVVCLSGIVEHPFFVCIFFSFLLSYFANCSTVWLSNLLLSPRTCYEGCRNCKKHWVSFLWGFPFEYASGGMQVDTERLCSAPPHQF